MPGTVAILMHATVLPAEVKSWAIFDLAEIWRAEGFEVTYLFGTAEQPPADLLIVHVDLSVVPDEYLEFASRYSRTVNERIKDIRKATISKLLLRAGDGYEGPCIVKSNLNCSGMAELVILSKRKERAQVRPPFEIRSQLDYRLYRSRRNVPAEYFTHPEVVVERFLPERDGKLYFTRSYHFFGNQTTTVRLGGPHPIVIGRTQTEIQDIEPHPSLLELRKRTGHDYGKIDYVEHDGEVFVFDVNKTTGAGGVSSDPHVLALRHQRALGIYDFLPR